MKVNPRSGKDQLLDLDAETIRIKLTAPPVEGEANLALIRFIARTCRIPKGNVEIVSGKKSRHKVILIRGLGLDTVIDRLRRVSAVNKAEPQINANNRKITSKAL